MDLAARLQSWRRGASLVELFVCLAIIATMITLLFPAIQSVRAGMKRAECGDHKRQLSLALGMYMEAARALPPAPTPTFPGGWAREILPFMEEKPLFEALDLRQPMTAAGNATAARNRPPLMQCSFAPWRVWVEFGGGESQGRVVEIVAGGQWP